jgi:PAS domain S-box-containing protein
MLQMYGYTRQEALRLTLADLSSNEPPYTQEGASERTGQAVEEGQVRFDWRARRRNGELFWVEVFLKRTEIGGENRILAVVRDINERKENESELLREKSFSQAVIDAIPGVFYVYDEMGNLIQWNKKLETISGYSAEELKGKKAWDFFAGEDQEKLISAFQAVFREGEKTIEFETALKDGRKVPGLFSARRLETDRGVFQVGIALDISDRKKVEAELRQAQKMEAIGTLAGGIAHDFNNILSAIIGFTELAKLETGDNAELSRYLKEVEAAAGRATDLVKQILTFSRQRERDKLPLEISLVVREALKLLRSSIPATIEIRQNIPPQRAVLADPTQIHQVVMNLCTNAYHAMQETGGTLGVTLKDIAFEEESVLGMEAAAGAYIELCVSDTGHGMDKDTMTRIFDPYFTSKEPGRGTGLGLSVVHGIVESHRGFIKVYSEPDEGTTFKVYLPVTSREAEERPESRKEPLRGGSERIMLVDDDQKIVDFGREILGRYGYEIEWFTNGVQALQSMEENPGRIDLLVTDMTMPYMTGMVLAKKILEIRPELPIILCTGFSELTSREKAAAVGIVGFLEKPVAVDNLVRTVREVLGRHSQQSPPEGSAPD